MGNAIPVTIVGGGLAGLTLGIALRQREVPVRVHEAGHYPRHRVCGEFISGHGQATLERLGLRGMLETAGAMAARTIAFFSANRSTGPRLLPAAGICLSRSILDALLAARFRDLGGVLVEGGRDNRGFGEGVVRATGRRAGADADGMRWFPPVTGNGMSMAFESAELAVDPLVAWSTGKLSWNEARLIIARDCDAVFKSRLASARWLQKIVQMSSLQDPLVALAGRSDWVWRLAFDRTR